MSRYNLRQKRGDSPGMYREKNEDEEQDKDDETTRSPRQQHNTSSRSHSDSSRMQSSNYDDDSSTLNSTGSDSFSFHSHLSSGGRSEGGSRMYPSLERLNSSPRSKRGSPRATGESLSPKRSDHGQGASQKQKQRQGTLQGMLQNPVALVCLVAIVALLLHMVINKKSSTAESSLEEKIDSFTMFSSTIDKLKQKYPDQSSTFWRMVKSCANHVLASEESTYPAVLLMVSEKQHATLTTDIASDVAQEFENAIHSRSISMETVSLNLTSSIGAMRADQQKLKVDSWLTQMLDNRMAVILNHLETLSPEAALILHAYCDGDNAPYKQAMLILVLYLDKQVDNSQAVEKALRNSWITRISDDKIGALLSRIANNVAFVTPPSV